MLVSASNGDAALYDKVLAVSRNSGDPGEKSDALRTLARFRDPALVKRTLDYIVSGEVRNQDSWTALVALLRDPRDPRSDLGLHPEKLGQGSCAVDGFVRR